MTFYPVHRAVQARTVDRSLLGPLPPFCEEAVRRIEQLPLVGKVQSTPQQTPARLLADPTSGLFELASVGMSELSKLSWLAKPVLTLATICESNVRIRHPLQ